MLVQIYEVQTPEEAMALSALGVDHIGVLVGEGAFPRELPAEQVLAIFAATPARSRRVALSLSPDLTEVLRVIRETRPDIIQVQASIEDLPPASLREVKARYPQVAIMRAIPIVDAGCVEVARSHLGVADFLLLDSYDPQSRQFGALGRAHDWALSRRVVDEVRIPAILAGGLGPDNVAQAIAVAGPAGVDSKTRTDRADGRAKDLDKVREFVRAATRMAPGAAAAG
ncbi:MAG TPA: phosphoribosylanthranilate isomerase [Stellaceae bacterium]|nr:phosphoribosylanthranilate isomerase [Stellaceae bacterium]